MRRDSLVIYCILTISSLSILTACDDAFKLEFKPTYSLGDGGNVEFYYSEPFCVFTEACSVDLEHSVKFEEAMGYPLFISVRTPDGKKPLDNALSFESSDPEVFLVGKTNCGDLDCTLNEGFCVAADPDCSSTRGIMQLNVELIPLKTGSAELRALDASGAILDRISLGFE